MHTSLLEPGQIRYVQTTHVQTCYTNNEIRIADLPTLTTWVNQAKIDFYTSQPVRPKTMTETVTDEAGQASRSAKPASQAASTAPGTRK